MRPHPDASGKPRASRQRHSPANLGVVSGGNARYYDITDLLIGDLFTDKVDKVWAPMEAMYGPEKAPIPKWDQGTPVDQAESKLNELFLPEGTRP